MSNYADRLRKADYLIEPCDIGRARRLVEQHHYARGASNTAAALYGLWRKADWALMGVAWWIPPTRDAASALWSDPDAVLSLSRLVLIPNVPKNAATFLLMRSVRRLDSRWQCLVTYADTWRGHTGHIYKAAGWEYLGMTKPERVYVLEGRMVSRKAGPVTRTHAEMLALGATCMGAFSKHRYRLRRKVQPRPQAQQLSLLALAA